MPIAIQNQSSSSIPLETGFVLAMNQTATLSGNGNTIIQVVGDGNHIYPGHPHLVVTRHRGRRQIRQDVDRLSPYARSTALHGRRQELDSLRLFVSGAQPIRVRVLIGPAGSGKTRLALELCEQLAADGIWDTGFVTGRELQRFLAAQNLSAWGWRKPTLIVVDSAAEHAAPLGQWIDELADREDVPPHPLRLLMLERGASVEGGWWSTVFASGGWGTMSKRALLDPVEPLMLGPIAAADDRLALVRDMVTQTNSGQVPDWLEQETSLREKLAQIRTGGEPLFLMMAALEMLRVGHAKALTLQRTDLAMLLAGFEEDRLKALAAARNLSPDLVTHLAGCVTLAQGMERREFERFAEAEKGAVGRPHGGDAAELADLLQEALPSAEGIAPMQPDLIGEAFTLRVMKSGKGFDAVQRCHVHTADRVAQSVIRCAQDFAPTEMAPVQWLQGMVRSRWSDGDALLAMLNLLPLGSVVLADVRLSVAERWREHLVGQPESVFEGRALAADMLCVARAQMGQWEAALEAGLEAVTLYRGSAAQGRMISVINLAIALNNLSSVFKHLNRPQEALSTVHDAVHLYSLLLEQRPDFSDVFLPNLATSLDKLGMRMGEIGMKVEALNTGQHAVGVYRELVAKERDEYLPGLARALTNLATRYGDLDKNDMALEAAREAVDLHRELAALQRDMHLPGLAVSLRNFAARLCELGQHQDALLPAEQAVSLYRELAEQIPDLFLPELAGSLSNLAIISRRQ